MAEVNLMLRPPCRVGGVTAPWASPPPTSLASATQQRAGTRLSTGPFKETWVKGHATNREKYGKGSFQSRDCDLAATSQFCVVASLSFSACGFHPLAQRLLTTTWQSYTPWAALSPWQQRYYDSINHLRAVSPRPDNAISVMTYLRG